MTQPDAVDLRLLALLADAGRIAVHQLAAAAGIDPREAASRLVALSGSGLPLLVGVECDQRAIHALLATVRSQSGPYGYPPMPRPSGPFPVSQENPPDFGQETSRTPRQTRANAVGGTQHISGSHGGQLSIRLVEVVDPADFLFTAAGYQLQPGERAVIVHTELTNRGQASFPAIPDANLVLVTSNSDVISKAPVSLSSRPAYRAGIRPGETVGGHTVYLVPESTDITGVRWSEQPNAYGNYLVWLLSS